MTYPIPDYLKLHIEETPVLADFPAAAPDILATLSDALLQATGWSMHYLNDGDAASGDANEMSDRSASQALSIPVLDPEQQPLGQFLIHSDESRETTPRP